MFASHFSLPINEGDMSQGETTDVVVVAVPPR